MKFTPPSDAQVKRMTSRTISVLLDTLKTQRQMLVEPYDNQIKLYEDLLAKKREEEQKNAQTTRAI